MCVYIQVAKDENDGDIRRLLRRATNRAKAVRRHRSKSAHGHLQSVRNEHSVEAAVNAAEKLKLSNDELHTTSSPDLDRRKGFALLSRLRDEQKKMNKDRPVSSSKHANEQTEVIQQHTEHAQRSPTLPNASDGMVLERARSRNPRPLATMQPTKAPSHLNVTSSLATVPRSYCGIGLRSESILLFPGHSRDILLKQSRDRLASASSNSSSGFQTLSSGRSALADESNSVDSFSAEKSAAAYLGSSVSSHRPKTRRVTMRNRAGLMMKCWQRPESNMTAEQVKHSGVTGQENRLSLTVVRDETGDVVSDKAESSTDVSPLHIPASNQLPFLEFKKADLLSNMSPLSLSVHCGSDIDDVDAAHETLVIPTHQLMSKQVWNVNTQSWEDAAEQRCTDSHETPDSCNLLTTNQNSRKIIFTRADSAGEPGTSNSTLRFANSCGKRCSFSESDIQKAAQSRLRETKNITMLHQPAVRNVNIGATISRYNHALRNRHSVTGCSCDEKLVSSLRQHTIQSFCRPESCPEMTAFSDSVLRSIHTSVRHHRKPSRFVGRIRPTVPKGFERRRKVNRVVRRHNLAPPLFASWPGKGDIKGSMLAYESSV